MVMLNRRVVEVVEALGRVFSSLKERGNVSLWVFLASLVMLPLVASCGGYDEEEGALIAGVPATNEEALGTCPSAGDYCGQDQLGLDNRTLYRCTAVGATPTVKQTCSRLCYVSPPGLNDICPANVKPKSGDMTILKGSTYSKGFLLYSGASSGDELSATYKRAVTIVVDGASVVATQMADTIGSYWGECVSLIKAIGDRTVANTSTWRAGAKVLDTCNIIPLGTAIATFKSNGSFDGTTGTYHVAFFAGCDTEASGQRSLWIWDQNFGKRAIQKHKIVAQPSGSSLANGPNDAAAYRWLVVPE